MSSILMEEQVIALMGDDVDTDVIFPTRYVAEFAEEEVAKHVFEDIEPDFVNKARAGGIVIAGKNFGCGSAREQAATGLKGAGVNLIIAQSFSRSFYRNGINVGLKLLEVEDLPKDFASEGHRLRVDFEEGKITNITSSKEINFKSPEKFLVKIMQAGGICNFYPQAKEYANS